MLLPDHLEDWSWPRSKIMPNKPKITLTKNLQTHLSVLPRSQSTSKFKHHLRIEGLLCTVSPTELPVGISNRQLLHSCFQLAIETLTQGTQMAGIQEITEGSDVRPRDTELKDEANYSQNPYLALQMALGKNICNICPNAPTYTT